jgi:hypothetical protein
MWEKYVQKFHMALELINNSLTECPAWLIIKHPLFMGIFTALLFIFLFRRMYKAIVAMISGLVLILISQSTLINVVVPDSFGIKLPLFIVGFIIIAAVNVYFMLIRD